MTILCLPAGTDAAEMALFDVDALPRRLPPDLDDFAQLASQARLVQFSTGGDGGYLLHLFVDEAIPAETMRYCVADDKLTGDFYTANGRVAFGGLESAYAEFKANPSIRADGLIEPGCYTYTAYHTDFPDELVEQAMHLDQTTRERWLSRAPLIWTLSVIVIAIALLVARQFVLVGLILLGAYFVRKWLRRLPEHCALLEWQEQAQLAFPSIVVELTLNSSIVQKANDAA